MDFQTWYPMVRSRFLFAALVVLLLCLAGCGQKDWGHVTGTVTVEGAPVGPGTILFEPTEREETTTRAAIGYFQEDGKYSLISAGKVEGIKAGEYRVMIRGGSQEASGDEQVDPNMTTKIPARYRENRSSGLTATVKPGNQTIDFDLEP